jgi:hypothetical protein
MSHTLFCYHVLSLLNVEQVATAAVAAHPYTLDPWCLAAVVAEREARTKATPAAAAAGDDDVVKRGRAG